MLRCIGLVLGAATLLASCGGAEERPACENPQTATAVTMADFSYEPGCVQTDAGTRLEIVNEGQAPHTFTIEYTVEGSDETVGVDVPAGDRATLESPQLVAGTYRVVCTYHPEMEAALRITG